MQYRQEILMLELMIRVSLKHHKWCYQVHKVKIQSLEQVHLQTKHHRRNKSLVKVCPFWKSVFFFFLYNNNVIKKTKINENTFN